MNEVVTQIETDFFDANEIPRLDKIEMERSRFDPIIKDVFSEHLSKYGWCQVIGTLFLSLFGIAASLFSNYLNCCWKIWLMVICIIIGGGFLVIPIFIKNSKRYVADIISIVDENISCIQNLGMTKDEWRSDIKKRAKEKDVELKDAAHAIDKKRKEIKSKIRRLH